jgi:radical SAM superfamily enzyme YgiQ (UPF0313 family)
VKIKILFIDLGSGRIEPNEPLGIETLSGYLKKNLRDKVEVELASYPLQGLAQITCWLEESSYHIIGLSAPLGSLSKLEPMVSLIRQTQPDPIILIGNTLPTFAAHQILNSIPSAIAVSGEGEQPILSIAKILSTNPLLTTDELKQICLNEEVPNLRFILNSIMIETKVSLHDITNDYAVPDRSLLPLLRLHGGIPRNEGSRGCGWGRCVFCAIPNKYGKCTWRSYPIERIITDLSNLSSEGVKSVYLTDEDFFGNKSAFTNRQELIQAIVEAKNDFRINPDMDFYIDVRTNHVVNPKYQKLLRDFQNAGLREVYVGIESGDPIQLKRYGKPANPNTNLMATQILKSMGLETDIGFIAFDPLMTLEELGNNLAFIKSAGLHHHDARLFKQLRIQYGTDLAQRYNEEGLVSISDLNLDNLVLDYEFRNPDIQRIYTVFRGWEELHEDIVYQLESLARGDNPISSTRKHAKSYLKRFRRLQFEVMENLYETTRCTAGDPTKYLHLVLQAVNENLGYLIAISKNFISNTVLAKAS